MQQSKPTSSLRARSSHQSSAGSQVVRRRGNVNALLDPTAEPWQYPLEPVVTPPALSRPLKETETGWCGPLLNVSEHLKLLHQSDDLQDFHKRNDTVFVHEQPNLFENNITRSELLPQTSEEAQKYKFQSSAQGLVHSIHESKMSHQHGRITPDWTARGQGVLFFFTETTLPQLYAEFCSRYLNRQSLHEWLDAVAVHAQLSHAQQHQFQVDFIDLFQTIDKDHTGYMNLSQFQNFLIDIGMRVDERKRPTQTLAVQSTKVYNIKNDTDHALHVKYLQASEQLLVLSNSSSFQVRGIHDSKFHTVTTPGNLGAIQFGLSAKIRIPYLFVAGVKGKLGVYNAHTLAPVSVSEQTVQLDRTEHKWLSPYATISNCLTAMDFSDAHSLLFSSNGSACDLVCHHISRKALTTSSDIGLEFTHHGSTIGHNEALTSILAKQYHNNDQLLTSSLNGEIKLWSMARAAPLHTVQHYNSGVLETVLHNDIILARTTMKVSLSSYDGQHIGVLVGSNATAMASIPDTPYVTTGDQTGTVKMWDIRMLQCVGGTLNTASVTPVHSLVGLPPSNQARNHQYCRVLAGTNTLTEYETTSTQSEKIPTVAMLHTPLLQLILTIDNRKLVAWSDKDGTIKHTVPFPSVLTSLHADPLARCATVGAADGTVYYVDITTQTIISQYKPSNSTSTSNITSNNNNNNNILCTCQSTMHTCFDYPMPCLARQAQKFILYGSVSPYNALKQYYSTSHTHHRKHTQNIHELLAGNLGHRLQGQGGCEGTICSKKKLTNSNTSSNTSNNNNSSVAILFSEYFTELGAIVTVHRNGCINYLQRKPQQESLVLLKRAVLPYKFTFCVKLPILGWLVLGTSIGTLVCYDYRAKSVASIIVHHKAEITNLCLLGNFPLLFTADIDGQCCIFAMKPQETQFPIVRWIHTGIQSTPSSGGIAALKPKDSQDETDTLMIPNQVSSVGLPTQSLAVAQAACLTSKRCNLTPCLYDATSTTQYFQTGQTNMYMAPEHVEPVQLVACHITASIFVPASCEQVVGDSQGHILCFSLTEFLNSNEILPLPDLDKYPVDQRANVLKKYTLSMNPFLAKIDACKTESIPLAQPGDILLQSVWKGGDGAVVHIAPLLTHDHASTTSGNNGILKSFLVSCSDQSVQAWGGEGYPLGFLASGNSTEHTKWLQNTNNQASSHLKTLSINQSVRKTLQKDDKNLAADKDQDFYSTLDKMHQDIQHSQKLNSFK